MMGLNFSNECDIIAQQNYYQMQTPHRQSPIQGFIISQSKPFLIDTDESHRQTKHLSTIASISKLPSFEPDDKLTKLLYSKFLVKGVKPINSGIMMNKIKEGYEAKHERKSKNNSPTKTKERIVTELSCSNNKLKKEQEPQKQLGVFQLSKDRHPKIDKKSRPLTAAFQRSQSLNHLSRPQSAAIHQNSSQKKLTRPLSCERTTTKNRSATAITRANSAKNQIVLRFEPTEENDSVRPILTITDDFSNFRNVNYIERNRRSASIKKITPYITDVEVTPHLSRKPSKEKEAKEHRTDDRNSARTRISAKEKQEIQQKHKDYLNYLKQHEPEQYSECMNYLISLDQNGNQLQKSIFDIALDAQDAFQPSKKEVQQEQVVNFYQNFYNICVDVEYGIKKTTKKASPPVHKAVNMLNIYECEELLAIYSEIEGLRQFNADHSLKNERIKQIIKNLTIFREMKPDILFNMLSMIFQIQSIREGEEIIKQDDEIRSVYIILNGSVSKKNKQEEDFAELNRHKMPQFWITLFDGEVFGLPSKPKQKLLHYSVKTLQKCLLMIFPYEQYRKALSNNQNIEDRIDLLQQVLPSTKSGGKMGKQDLQIIAFQMQSSNFSANEVIFREGQNCCNLLLVAGGRVAICFQYFQTRKKTNLDSLRKTSNQRPSLKMKDYRRRNLKNYELVHENGEEMTYYYCELVEEKVRGDALNWHGFRNKMLPEYIADHDFVHSLTYSIISLHDNTRLYQLPPHKLDSLPAHIQDAITETAEGQAAHPVHRRNQKEAQKWEKFKHSLVASLLSGRQGR